MSTNPTVKAYEPPISEKGSIIPLEGLGEIYPGVRGYAVLHGSEIYIPDIEAVSEGSGQVGRFLDSLSTRCVIVNVVSPRLAGMLERRGWKCKWVNAEPDGQVDEWRRQP